MKLNWIAPLCRTHVTPLPALMLPFVVQQPLETHADQLACSSSWVGSEPLSAAVADDDVDLPAARTFLDRSEPHSFLQFCPPSAFARDVERAISK